MKTFTKRTSLWWILAVAGAGTIFACSGQTLDAGRNDRGGNGGSSSIDGGEPLHYSNLNPPSHSYREGCEASVTSEFNGTWRGTFDDYTNPSGSRSVRLVVEAGTAAGICGSVTFGDGEPPPLPTDREAPYAPGLEGKLPGEVTLTARAQTLVEGFVYQFGRGKLLDIPDPESSIHLARIHLRQPYKAWCEIQYSYPVERKDPWQLPFSCVPDYTSTDLGSEDCKLDGVATSCTQVQLCAASPYCLCSFAGCSMHYDIDADYPNVEPTAVTIEFAGDSASGAIPLADGIHAFTLTRSSK